jgi:hypothetical protein
MRRTLLIFSLFGFSVFAAILATSFFSPLTIERVAREIVRIEVERRVANKIDALSSSRVVVLAQKALGKTDAELEDAKRLLAEDVPRKVAAVVANMSNADCECRKRLAQLAVNAQKDRIADLTQVRERLASLIESAYASVSAQLLRELRIFAGSNALAFAALGAVTYARRGAALQLVLPAFVLLGALTATSVIYLFNQDWLHTIVYSDYVGFAYLGYLALASALLADVVFNRARVTTKAVNAIFSAVGSVLHASPC